MKSWTGIDDPSANERLIDFCRTGGDGSHAALWRDPDGRVRIVHMGSGSGSIWGGVITDSPVDFLRFVAIGYNEACWPGDFSLTPQQVAERDDAEPPVPPQALRDYLIKRYGVTIPLTARSIIPVTPSMDDTTSRDPFLAWLQAAQNERDQK